MVGGQILSLILTLTAAPASVDAAGKASPPAQVCTGTKYNYGSPFGPFEWGTVIVANNHLDYTINAGYQVTLCVKGGTANTTSTLTGPTSGELFTPALKNGKNAGVSHWSVVTVTTIGP